MLPAHVPCQERPAPLAALASHGQTRNTGTAGTGTLHCENCRPGCVGRGEWKERAPVRRRRSGPAACQARLGGAGLGMACLQAVGGSCYTATWCSGWPCLSGSPKHALGWACCTTSIPWPGQPAADRLCTAVPLPTSGAEFDKSWERPPGMPCRACSRGCLTVTTSSILVNRAAEVARLAGRFGPQPSAFWHRTACMFPHSCASQQIVGTEPGLRQPACPLPVPEIGQERHAMAQAPPCCLPVPQGVPGSYYEYQRTCPTLEHPQKGGCPAGLPLGPSNSPAQGHNQASGRSGWIKWYPARAAHYGRCSLDEETAGHTGGL